MTTEPFRYDQQVLDVSEMNMTSGLRNSLIPSSASVRLGLSSDLLSSHDILGRSADGVTLATGSDSAFSSAPMLMAGHHKAMNHSQLAPPLSSSLFAAGLPSMSSANVSAALSSLSSNGQANPNLNPPLPDHNASAAANGAYLPNGARNPPTSNGSSSTRDAGPTPIIQIPSSLQSSGPTLSEAMAMGVDAESLQRAMQNAPHNSGPFNMAHYLQQHRAATSSPSASQSSQQQSTPVITSSGQLRYSGDRFASSAFSPVSPGGTSTASKISSIAYSSTSGGQTPTPGSVIPPLAQMTAHMSPLQFASPSGQSASSPMQNMGGHMVQSPYTPASMGSMNPQTPSSYGSYDPMGSRSGTDMHSNGMSNSNMGSPSMMNGMNGGDAMSPYSTMTPGGPNSQSSISTPHVTTPGGTVLAVGPPPHKRPYLGPNSNDPQLYRPMHPGSGPSSDASDDSSRTAQGMMMMMPGTPGVNSGMGMYSQEDIRTQTLLQSLNTFGNGLALANNAVKQENMIQEHMLGHGVLAGPGSAAFVYQGKAIPYSEEAARQHYMMLEEAKQGEIAHIRTHLAREKKNEAMAKGVDDNYLSESHLEHRKIKKLHPLTYDAIYRAIISNMDGAREKYLLNDHPQVDSLLQLPGRVYVVQVSKGTRKPPHVGFPFRSYSDSHYTSVDRENPVICKVKEWPVDNDPKNIWRLYHYYLGNKKRAPRSGPKKRRSSEDPSID